MRPPARAPRRRAGAVRLAVLSAVLALAGCSSFSSRSALPGRGVEAAYQPLPESAEFRGLGLEKTPSIVVLKIDGDDVRGNMAMVSQVLLSKGYSVRDYSVTLRDLTRAGLLHGKPLEPETIEKASRLFTEAAAVAGTVEVVQLEPLQAQLSLAWIDLRTRKTLWTAKAAYSAYAMGGGGRYEEAVRGMIERALAPVPAAKP